MTTEFLGVVTAFLVAVALAVPFGRYLARVFTGEPTLLDNLMGPLERFFFKACGVDPGLPMTWKEHLKAMLSINLLWFLFAMLILMNQGRLPLNPDGNPNMSADLAFNTAVSFVVNCNLQHYSGEAGMSYLGQIAVLMYLQFVSAATGMAMAAAVFNSFRNLQSRFLGNFYDLFVKSGTRILLPVSLTVALILMFEGVPMTFEGKDTMVTLQGDTVQVSRGPVAAFVAIKHVGTNGGGFFGTNTAHPFENPDYLTAMLLLVCQMIIPLAMVFAWGESMRRRRFAVMVFGVMTVGFLMLAVPAAFWESAGNPEIAKLGISQPMGNMEGKEVRIGPVMSGFHSIATTVISTGSVYSMHDSSMPLSGMNQLLAMMVNAFYGGVGVGILNFYVFLIIAVFIGGLMVGRTPELMGKKVEAREMKIATIVALLHPFLILAFSAIAACKYGSDPGLPWLNNPGAHGFSEMLYEFTSASANNGSGFEGLADNTPFWNVATGIVLLLGRYLPVIGPVAIAGLLAAKKQVPETAGTLKTDTGTFGLLIFSVIIIITALAFFPALALGPIAEYFSL